MTLSIRRYAWSDGTSEEERRARLLEEPLSTLNIALRTVNILESHGITTVKELLQQRAERLREIKGIGERALQEIYGALEEHGFHRVRKTESSTTPDLRFLKRLAWYLVNVVMDNAESLTTTEQQKQVYENILAVAIKLHETLSALVDTKDVR